MPTVGILGAGTMGAGIAQDAAAAGWHVLLKDVTEAVVAHSIEGVRSRYARLVEKGRLSESEAAAASGRLTPAADFSSLRPCDLVVEAVVENFEVKVTLLKQAAEATNDTTILASNTSSLSIRKIADAVEARARVVGMHFFNPVPLMPLVECIAGDHSSKPAQDRIYEIAREWGKTPVRCADTPGFIVNRVARGYYLEPLRLLDEGVAGIDEIDATLTRLGGFKMGPFALMDLIGIDVNYPVSCSVWEQMGRPARLTPHPLQAKLFEAGQLGRKTKRGAYSYEHETPMPALLCDRKSFEMREELYNAVRRFCDGATRESGSSTEQYIFARTLAAIINEAALAIDDGIATDEDIDTAMRLGTNYPMGPIAWARKIGTRTTRALLEQLNARATDGRFAPAEWLRQ